MCGATPSVMTCHKGRADGEEIGGEVAKLVPVAARTVNQEFEAIFCKDVFQEVCGKARQSIFVHDHNFADHAAETAFQNGVQALAPLALEVDARADVADDVVVGVGVLERFDLAVEVTSLPLLVGADAGVYDAAPTSLLTYDRVTLDAERGRNGRHVVESLSAGATEGVDEAVLFPFLERGDGDAIVGDKPTRRSVRIVRWGRSVSREG